MDYTGHTPRDIEEMLKVIGVADIDELFADIPSVVGLNRPVDLPAPLSEIEVTSLVTQIAGENLITTQFIGAGAYRHHIPAALEALASRSEFYTSYTPYQPEVSQGTLAAIFEFQTLICRLTGMDVANASMYDGATALAEAVFLAVRSNDCGRVLVSRAVHPHYRQVLSTYAGASGLEIAELPLVEGGTGAESVEAVIGEDVSAVVIQNPTFFGCLENVKEIADAAHRAGAYLIVAVTEPLSLALLKSPGSLGADIVCGEGQSFGNPVGMGGPMLGLFAAKKEFVRRMPGRLAGRTVDADGNEAYVLTLQTREQHIRRERATSNICTNQGLCALRAAIYLVLLGNGLRDLADINHRTASHLRRRLLELGAEPAFNRPFFNEFTVRIKGLDRVSAALRNEGFAFGLPLGGYYDELADCAVLCATELCSAGDIDRLASAMERVLKP